MGNVARRPDGTWRARYRGPDRKERSRHFTKKSDAQRWLASVEVSKARGEWIDPTLARTKVGQWCRHWLDAQGHLKASTRARYDSIITNYIEPTWDQVELAHVTPSDVAKWIGSMTARGLAPGTVKHNYQVLAQSLAYAVLDGRLHRNPAQNLPLPRARAKPRQYLTHGEVASLADECGPYRLLILVLAYTGMRWGEAAAVRVNRVDLLRRRVIVDTAVTEVHGELVVGTPKDHEMREVPIPGFLIDELTQHMAGMDSEALVFASPNGAYLRNTNFRKRAFNDAVANLGLHGVTPHSLRHTAASLAIQAGATVVVIQRMLGHSSPSITLDVDSHLFADDLDTVADRLHEAKLSADADRVRTTPSVVTFRGGAGRLG